MAVEQISAAQGVARSLEEQHGNPDLRQMIDTWLVGLAWRMERVGIEDHAPSGIPVGNEHRRHSAPHRPAAEYEGTAETLSHFVCDSGVATHELWRSVRAFSPRFGVAIVERHHPDPALCQRSRDTHDAAVMLVGPRSVREEHGGLAVSPNCRRDRIAVREIDLHDVEGTNRAEGT